MFSFDICGEWRGFLQGNFVFFRSSKICLQRTVEIKICSFAVTEQQHQKNPLSTTEIFQNNFYIAKILVRTHSFWNSFFDLPF